jgi:hypothetical protein
MSKKFALSVVLLFVLLTLLVSSVSAVNYGHTLFSSSSNHAEYPRALKLANGKILVAFPIYYGSNNSAIRFYRSTNNGETFSFVTEFRDAEPLDIGAPALIESPAGTLLFAYNLMDDNDHALGEKIKVWKSTNEGATWTHLATPEPGGMWCWEPEFVISSDGKLQLYYSYAGTTMDMFKQNIVRRESSNGGVTWGNRVTAVGNSSHHVGMARVAKGGSTYYMAVEYYEDMGGVRVVKGTDGKTWSSVATAPAMDKDNDGWMFSTPALTYVNGALIGMGKRYQDWYLPFPWGYDERNGKVVLYSKDGGQTWKEMTAPFEIQFNDDSSNWSPTLLPLSNTQLFMISNSDTASAHRIQYDTGPISTP